MRIGLYMIGIILANVVTAAVSPFMIYGLLVPAGTFLIGFTFIMRDLVQMQVGKQRTYLVIIAALAISAVTSYLLGDGIRIVMASALSFAISEATDTELFSRLRTSLDKRIAISGTIGGIIDSFLFAAAAGFPIQAAYGQAIVKVLMQWIGALIIKITANK